MWVEFEGEGEVEGGLRWVGRGSPGGEWVSALVSPRSSVSD